VEDDLRARERARERGRVLEARAHDAHAAARGTRDDLDGQGLVAADDGRDRQAAREELLDRAASDEPVRAEDGDLARSRGTRGGRGLRRDARRRGGGHRIAPGEHLHPGLRVSEEPAGAAWNSSIAPRIPTKKGSRPGARRSVERR